MTVLLVSTVSSQFQNQQFFTGGGCSQIKGLGSPILMVANAHKYINDALNSKNPYTDVALLSFTETPNTTTNATNYKMVFGVTTLKGLEYFAIDFDAFGDGFGAMKTNRMLVTPNLVWVGAIFSLDTTTFAEINCGDLKFMFSFYGQDPTADLPFVWPGRNQNSVGLGILNRINIENQNNGVTQRVCTLENYLAHNFLDEAATPAPPADLDVNFGCAPSGLNVNSFTIECVDGTYGIDVINAGITDGVGGFVPTLVFDGAVGGNDILEVFDLTLGDTLVFLQEDTVSQRIELYSDGTLVQEVECGDFVGPADDTITIAVEDFMGFDEEATAGGGVISGLELIEYNG